MNSIELPTIPLRQRQVVWWAFRRRTSIFSGVVILVWAFMVQTWMNLLALLFLFALWIVGFIVLVNLCYVRKWNLSVSDGKLIVEPSMALGKTSLEFDLSTNPVFRDQSDQLTIEAENKKCSFLFQCDRPEIDRGIAFLEESGLKVQGSW